MADNLTTTTTVATIPNATTIHTDDLGVAGHVQYVKLMDGTNNGTDAIGGDAANGLDVDVTRVQGSVAVTGTFWQATQPISAAALPLPTGAATSAKQPALGTAGSSSADVISVQGIASGTALKVDGSAVTQPVSGTFWQATQPVSGPLTDTQLRATPVPISGTVTTSNPNAYTEDAVAPGDPVGTSQVIVQVASPADRGAAAGDWVAKAGTKYGAELVQLVTSTGSFIDSVGGGSQFAEDAAHVSGDIGTVALAVRTDVPVQRAGTDADYAVLQTDADGKLWVNTGTVRARKLWVATTITAATTETTIVAAVASESHDLYGISLTNTGVTATKVSLRDDTAGTVKQVLFVPAGSTVGWMLPVDSAIPQTAQNKNWTATCGSSTSSLEVTAFYLKVT